MTSPRSLCDSDHADGTPSSGSRRKEQNLKCGPFDLALTLQSGQVFHACEAGGWSFGTASLEDIQGLVSGSGEFAAKLSQ